MNTLPFLTRNKSVPYKFYIIVILCLTLSMVFYVLPDAMDITRYYEGAEIAFISFPSVVDYAKDWIETHVDFIYPSSLFLALKFGISMDVVTVFYMSLYYVAVFEIIRKHFPYFKIPVYVFFYSVMFAPFIWVQEISRNLAAISFFYLAISSFLDGKTIKAIIWIAASVLTHISMLMYLPVVACAFLLSKINLNKYVVYLSIFGALCLSYITPSQILNIISLVMEGSESRYAVYGDMQAQGALMNAYIGYGDKVPMVTCLAFSILLLFLNKNKDFMYWMLYMLTLMLSFFILSSLMFTNRVIMLMTVFIVYNTYQIMSKGNQISKQAVSLFSVLGCFAVLLHLYSYRAYYSL